MVRAAWRWPRVQRTGIEVRKEKLDARDDRVERPPAPELHREDLRLQGNGRRAGVARTLLEQLAGGDACFDLCLKRGDCVGSAGRAQAVSLTSTLIDS